jgi:asparagine synthetase B (glutamine-hydrolysing)
MTRGEAAARSYTGRLPAPTPLETAAGRALGEAAAPPLPEPAGSPRAALECALTEALAAPPCLVAFSGGRDSSALLALALHVAAREDLPPPIPIALRFPGVPDTDETRWQDLVVEHLRPADWVRLQFRDELDLVGAVAARVLVRHGPIYPPNAHFALPMLECARGGVLVTGLDGDYLFAGWRWAHLGGLLRGRAHTRPRDVVSMLSRAAPRRIQRRLVALRGGGPARDWLTEAAGRELATARVREVAEQPRRFDGWVAWFARRRHVVLQSRQLDLLAADAGARIVHPLLDPRFLSACARWGDRDGPGDRTAAMRALFAGLLPEQILTRTTKARFDGVFMGRRARTFARAAELSRLDGDLVRPDALAREWARPSPSFATAMLLQSLWLAQQPGSRA